jgi:hypothetical protein
MTAPPSILGLTRWTFDGARHRFHIWARPIISQGGREVVPVTLVWEDQEGRRGAIGCSGLVDAVEQADRLAAGQPTS